MPGTDLKIITLEHQINYVGRSKRDDNAAKDFDILATSLSVQISQYNYLDGPIDARFVGVIQKEQFR